MTVRIEHNEIRTSIEIDGRDVSHCVRAVTIHADATHGSRAVVTLAPPSFLADVPDELARFVHDPEPRRRRWWQR